MGSEWQIHPLCYFPEMIYECFFPARRLDSADMNEALTWIMQGGATRYEGADTRSGSWGSLQTNLTIAANPKFYIG